MCKYASSCQLCNYPLEVKTDYKNVQVVTLNISSKCPNLKSIADKPITLEPMKELMASREKSDFYRLLDQHPHPDGCTVYESVQDAIGKSLGRYYELA